MSSEEKDPVAVPGIPEDELRVETFPARSGQDVLHVGVDQGVRITHLPTGHVAESRGERSQLKAAIAGDPPAAAGPHTHPGTTWHPGWKGHDGYGVHRHDSAGRIEWEPSYGPAGYEQLVESFRNAVRGPQHFYPQPPPPVVTERPRVYFEARPAADSRRSLVAEALEQAEEFFGSREGLAIEPGWTARPAREGAPYRFQAVITVSAPAVPPSGITPFAPGGLWSSLAAEARSVLARDDGGEPFIDRHMALRRFAQHVAEGPDAGSGADRG